MWLFKGRVVPRARVHESYAIESNLYFATRKSCRDLLERRERGAGLLRTGSDEDLGERLEVFDELVELVGLENVVGRSGELVGQ